MTTFVRLFGGGLGILVAVALSVGGALPPFGLDTVGGVFLVTGWLVAWFVIGFSILPYVTFVPARALIKRVLALSTGEFVSAIVGLIIGLVIGILLGLPMASLPEPFRWLFPLGTVIVTGLGMMGLTVAKRHDLAELVRTSGLLPTPAAPDDDGIQDAPVTYVDTSALIDGRITDVVASGFLFGTLVVPRFVIDELQGIADHREQARRVRGRRGLEVVSVLQKDPRVAVELSDENPHNVDTVDAKLIDLAHRRHAAILTNDFNLNRVAQLHEVRILNINQLANAVKPAFLPGDPLKVKVIQQGKEPGQGVAYLDDGTMIVVEGGGTMLEREVDVTVVRVLQTVAGRMVFAQPRS